MLVVICELVKLQRTWTWKQRPVRMVATEVVCSHMVMDGKLYVVKTSNARTIAPLHLSYQVPRDYVNL